MVHGLTSFVSCAAASQAGRDTKFDMEDRFCALPTHPNPQLDRAPESCLAACRGARLCVPGPWCAAVARQPHPCRRRGHVADDDERPEMPQLDLHMAMEQRLGMTSGLGLLRQ